MLLRRRLPLVALSVLALGGMLAGCAPDPAPTPSPTPAFASDEEAFAAAEEVYRAYNDALNDVDFSSPRTFEGVYSLLTGEMSASTRESFSAFHADGITVTGRTDYFDLAPANIRDLRTSVTINVCVDVSSVHVFAATGESLVPPDRPSIQPMSVTLKATGGDLRIATLEPAAEVSCER
ncbi:MULTISPECIES: hypothetical protein [unclassified Microbacterium]|uniref:hypothetical protein n=1 Tax=unclassified Microbacterium TaxID=2609290 RepID=UPI00343BC752